MSADGHIAGQKLLKMFLKGTVYRFYVGGPQVFSPIIGFTLRVNYFVFQFRQATTDGSDADAV